MKKILVFTDWYLPAYKAGGPVRSVANITNYLNTEFEFYIVTSDRDLGDSVAFSNVELNKWQELDNTKILYLSREYQNISFYKSILEEENYHTVYLNSLFSIPFTISPLISTKSCSYPINIVLAPRGMLGEGAMKIKALKKHLFLLFGRVVGLFKSVKWHATEDQEKKEIQSHFGVKSEIFVAPNIPTSYNKAIRKKEKGQLNLLFYSRISVKKNLLEALCVLNSDNYNGKLEFTICGPREDKEYWKKCEHYISQLRIKNIGVTVLEPIKPEEADSLFTQNHVFLLPTRHENFGHVIAEVLSSGMPILISDQTPWTNLKEVKAGFDLPLSGMDEFKEKIQFFLDMDECEYNLWSEGAYKLFKDKMSLENLVNNTRLIFES